MLLNIQYNIVIHGFNLKIKQMFVTKYFMWQQGFVRTPTHICFYPVYWIYWITLYNQCTSVVVNYCMCYIIILFAISIVFHYFSESLLDYKKNYFYWKYSFLQHYVKTNMIKRTKHDFCSYVWYTISLLSI